MTDHCPACRIRRELHEHRDATYPEWSTTRGVLNFAAVLAGRACPGPTTPPPTIAALARGLYDLDRHKWGHIGDYESLRPHYERDAERFLLPHLTTPPPPTEETANA